MCTDIIRLRFTYHFQRRTEIVLFKNPIIYLLTSPMLTDVDREIGTTSLLIIKIYLKITVTYIKDEKWHQESEKELQCSCT